MLTYETRISTSVHSIPTSPLTRRAARMAPVLARLRTISGERWHNIEKPLGGNMGHVALQRT